MSCITCTKLRPIKKSTSDGCRKRKQRIEEVRVYCPDTVTETVSETVQTGCLTGYISNMINPDPSCNPTPLVCVDVLNPDDLDEINDYTFDRSEDAGTEIWSFSPLKIKVIDAEHQCTLDSWKGQDLAIVYKIINKEGDWQWRRLLMKLTSVNGGMISGYEVTFDTENPRHTEKPLFVNFGDPETTEAAIDAMTDFDGATCVGLLYSRIYFEDGARIEVTDYMLPLDTSKILVHKNGLLMTESHPEGYEVTGNGIDILDPDIGNVYQILIYA